MAGKGKLPARSTSPGNGPAQKKAPAKTVGYGMKGGKFTNQTKYNQSKSGQAHAKNPSLSKTPLGTGSKGNVFFNAAKYEASKAGKSAGGHIGGQSPPQQPHYSPGQAAHFASAEVSKATPVPKAAGMTIKSIVRK